MRALRTGHLIMGMIMGRESRSDKSIYFWRALHRINRVFPLNTKFVELKVLMTSLGLARTWDQCYWGTLFSNAVDQWRFSPQNESDKSVSNPGRNSINRYRGKCIVEYTRQEIILRPCHSYHHGVCDLHVIGFQGSRISLWWDCDSGLHEIVSAVLLYIIT